MHINTPRFKLAQSGSEIKEFQIKFYNSIHSLTANLFKTTTEAETTFLFFRMTYCGQKTTRIKPIFRPHVKFPRLASSVLTVRVRSMRPHVYIHSVYPVRRRTWDAIMITSRVRCGLILSFFVALSLHLA